MEEKNILYLILGCSILINILLIFSISQLDTQWENDYNDLSVGWCEITNDYADVVNDLLVELQYYNSNYSNIDFFEETDCWS